MAPTVEDVLMIKGPDVIVTSRETTVREAARMMAEANCGAVIVLDPGQEMGIFTERDVLRRVVAVGADPQNTPLSEVMSSPVHQVPLSATVRQCTEIMTSQHIRHLAAVEEGALVGVISFRDVLSAEIRLAEDQLRQAGLNA